MNERIKKLRKSKNLSMEKFGEKLGVGKVAISYIESGKRGVTDQMVKSICREFGVTEEWLRYGTGEMKEIDASEELEALAVRYKLSHGAQIAVEKFVNMEDEDQQVLLNYFKEVAAALASDDVSEAPAPPPALDLSKLSIDEKVALYRQELEREEKAREKSEVS